MNQIKDTLQYIIDSIVNSTEITIDERTEGDMSIFEISAPEEIVGRIIGKEGKIIKSIRSIVNLSYPQNRFLIKIKD